MLQSNTPYIAVPMEVMDKLNHPSSGKKLKDSLLKSK